MSVVGARPQFVKLSPIDHQFQKQEVEHIIVHTGQHYDPMLSEVFFQDLQISTPNEHLGIGSGSHGTQTGRMLAELEPVFEKYQPDWVLVYGDTNSTLAAAIAAVKLEIKLAHLEAGLRSFNRSMPEEHNRVLTDHAADLLLAPTEVAVEHLTTEGLASRTVLVGDVMTDVALRTKDQVTKQPNPLTEKLGLTPGAYRLATIHRPYNTDHPEKLAQILSDLGSFDLPTVILAHPRLVAKCEEHQIPLTAKNLIVQSPLAYPQLVRAAIDAAGIITDSGGLQKEAFLLRVPCTTVRPETEWVETVDLGWNCLAEPGVALRKAVCRPAPVPTTATPYGDGQAAQRVTQALLERSRA